MRRRPAPRHRVPTSPPPRGGSLRRGLRCPRSFPSTPAPRMRPGPRNQRRVGRRRATPVDRSVTTPPRTPDIPASAPRSAGRSLPRPAPGRSRVPYAAVVVNGAPVVPGIAVGGRFRPVSGFLVLRVARTQCQNRTTDTAAKHHRRNAAAGHRPDSMGWFAYPVAVCSAVRSQASHRPSNAKWTLAGPNP